MQERDIFVRASSALGLVLGLLAGLSTACGDDSSDTPAADADLVCRQAGPLEVKLATDDGVELIADAYTTGNVGDPGIILLHMIPPGHSKANYPIGFIQPLVDAGFQVINVNRRGATGSGGVAEEAYMGPNGKLDAKAGYDFLLGHPCAVPANRIAVVGASNGTTTAADFSIFAAGDATVEQPFAMIFLSGGTYTENQNSIADNLAALSNHPILFAYPTVEAEWNDGIAAIAPASWSFTELNPGSHGTFLFDSDPGIIQSSVDFIGNAQR